MSDTTYIGRRMKSFHSSPQFDGFSRVVITVSDEIEYSAGTELGRTLRLTCPWGTPQMAKNILADIKGFQYQPYTAEGAIIDPAAELGDGITVNNIYGGIYTKKIKFGPLLTATVSAPEDEEINHEYPYKSKQNKKISREAKMLRASLAIEADRITAEIESRVDDVADLNSKLTVQANLISTEVSERKADTSTLKSSITQESSRITAEIEERTKETTRLSSTLDQQAGQISAKVSKTGGKASSFGWDLTDSSWTIKANNREILKATVNGLEVYGKITATSGKIGGFNILSNYLSYNNQIWGGTNSTGIYIGTSGIQLGKYFKVDSSGNLTARSGNFEGTVYAGNISYGDDVGRMSGHALDYNTLPGSRLEYSTVGSSYVSDGINAGVAGGTFAADVFNGDDTAHNITADYITATSGLYVPVSGVSGKTRKVCVDTVTINGHVYNILTV